MTISDDIFVNLWVKADITQKYTREDLYMANKTIRVFEGFAGYGGASFGLKRSGLKYKVVGMSEFDKFASELLAKNFPGIKNWGDITIIEPDDLPDFDLFTGGFPCQPFSSAGLQLGEKDKYGRGTLLHHILRIVEAKRPEYILLENVKGLTAKKFEGTLISLKKNSRKSVMVIWHMLS